MTDTDPPVTLMDTDQDATPSRGRASCTFRNSFAATGREGVSKGHAPASGEAGEARHQGAPGSGVATEGGSRREGEDERPAALRTRYRLRQSAHRDHVRSVRLSGEELELVQGAAESVGLKTAGFLVDAAVAVAQAQGGPKTWLMDQRGRVEELMAASTQLARVGNNLNQIARVLNSGGHVEYTDDAVARVLRAAARVEAAAIDLARR
ncbi:MobC family plasmid mobilization relaxosome protein [Streptomyces sp. SDT5-1]|uniref:MobC family plasmid mobilization relaxosome protein n=1 Tax=Streptomyces sp. SDT5-1 TaxID=3406418 RepID=UPI003FD3E4DB